MRYTAGKGLFPVYPCPIRVGNRPNLGDMPQTVYTIGHSIYAIETFVQILQAFQIEMLVDVRRFAKSSRNPQFNDEALSNSLLAHGIGYLHLEGLGGRRRASPASLNTAWKNASFRGYADYMQTAGFAENLERLIHIASQKRTVIMCAEAVPWRCHRSLIGDALLVRGFVVEDILNEKTSRPHRLTGWAKVAGTVITYPEDEKDENSSTERGKTDENPAG